MLFFLNPNKKILKKLQPIVDQINALEPTFEKFSDQELHEQTKKFQQEIKEQKKSLDDILPEAFAVVREAAKRVIKQRHFDVQLLGGIILHQGKIAEMKTGEGKTLVATLPAYLNALEGRGVHIITVNDYLTQRDALWMGRIFNFLGLSIGCIQHEKALKFFSEKENNLLQDLQTINYKLQTDLIPVSRKEAYACDILYGTNNEFGFDYLKDNMVYNLNEMNQRSFNYAIIDEIDSILIDEARTPLIISAPAEESAEQYNQFAQLIRRLKENEDYNIDEKMKAATLTEEGISKMEKWLGMQNIYTEGGINLVHHLEEALKAETLFKCDRDYVIKEGEIMIVDEFTGRLMPGRRYSGGLHQAIEAKEGVQVQKESVTLATITFQNYFRIYKKLAGMTGTAITSAEEFSKVYNLDVVAVPTNNLMIRKDLADKIYKTEEGKYKAIVEKIKELHQTKQPVLVGTISITKNELLGELLDKVGIPYEILNAKNHWKEAEIISQAGKKGAVTIATNMAGRGVDIILGGKKTEEISEEEYQKTHNEVVSLGGLYMIGSERHEARRIDNQLRGRSGRQGDPGCSQFFISMEDDLMRIFGSVKMKEIMTHLGLPDDMPIENKMISHSIEAAQNKIEGYNFDVRKHLLEYDDVINKHRETIYKKRREALEPSKNLKEIVLEMIEKEIEQVVSFHTSLEDERQWDLEEIYEVVHTIFPISKEVRIKLEDIEREAGNKTQDILARTKIIQYLVKLSLKEYDKLEEKINLAINNNQTLIENNDSMRKIEKEIILRSIDNLWIEHLEAIDYLKTGIGLRGYGQRDPLIEFKKEAYRMFNELINIIEKQIVYSIYKIGFAVEIAPSIMQKNNSKLNTSSKIILKQKISRNDLCSCGSGKKYKHCCGK
ncbi:preprotein translocase subunit SecA [Candidatus Kuenenbacteria bacterium HGW-Kuenenbacteria-1]|uniref:Protein translocase subunit SecA n=1 Tax=Candidatus Kuenenbacteria bacterium HGW-Kuenenbacteria-1 TaxID=2013812 RepID=A0A2N1UPG9_9BACT|nr:MAG: preprotein translocase subunit SecA [Candidatus Kuenenbacteria bacterium HGW-Kuenenbacteria-1]